MDNTNTYIVQLHEGYTRDVLIPHCIKVGCPEQIHDVVIIEATIEQAAYIETMKEVECVEIDSVFIDVEYSKRNIGNYALPSLNLDKKQPNTYLYNRTGKGVNLVVVDSGIRTTNEDFGKVETIFSAIDGQTWDSENVLGINRRHGTICSSAAFGKKYGVAPDVNAYNCFTNFSHSHIIKSYDRIITLHKSTPYPTVVSMSYMSASSVSNRSIQKMADAGILCFAAVGNWNENLDDIPRWPSANEYVFGIGALENNMNKASFSSFGKDAEIWAAGQNVLVASIRNDADTTFASGTSLSCPYVAGVMALFLEGSDKPESLEEVVQIRDKFLEHATQRVNGRRAVYSLVSNESFVFERPEPVIPEPPKEEPEPIIPKPVIPEPPKEEPKPIVPKPPREEPEPIVPEPPKKKSSDNKAPLIIGALLIIGFIVYNVVNK